MRMLSICLLCTVLFMGSTDPDSTLTDLEKYYLKGNVKSLMEIRYSKGEGADSNARGKVIYQKYTTFDENGFEMKTVLYKDGGPFLTSTYVFGGDEQQVEMNQYHRDGTLNVNVKFTYDAKGFRTRADYHWAESRQNGDFYGNTDYYYEILNNDIYDKVVYKNEYRGYCLEEHYLRPDSTLSFKFVSKYDFRGNKLESAYLHGSGRLSWMTKNKYDRYDNMIESRVYKSNRIAVLTQYTYEFDAVGNWLVRKENREVYVNILTAGLEQGDMVTERTIDYY